MNKSLTILSLGLAVLSLASCGAKKSTTQTQDAPVVVPSVKTVVAENRMVSVDQSYSVTLQAYAVNNIAPQATGRITSIKAEIGDFVKKGQLLAEMDRANLDQTELSMKNKKSELERLKSLYEKGGVSQSDYEAAELAYKVSCSQYENLKDNTILKSPLNGVVTARGYDQGDMYSMSSPLYVVQQIDPMKVLVAVSERDYPLLKKGVKVDVTADALPGKTFKGEVVRVYPTIDATTHTVNAEVNIPNPKSEMRPGMYANARVIFGQNSRIVLPDTAVLKQQGSGQKTVFILGEDNTVSLRVVEVGRHMGAEYEILSGIKEGEIVVVSGQSALRSGSTVKVLN